MNQYYVKQIARLKANFEELEAEFENLRSDSEEFLTKMAEIKEFGEKLEAFQADCDMLEEESI